MFGAFGVGQLYVKTPDIGVVGGPHQIRMRIPLHALEVFGDRRAHDGKAIPVSLAIFEQRILQKRYAANITSVFGNITAARLQTPGKRSLFEDFP
jgi:hypothetical protein